MTPQRARAYARVTRTLKDLGPAKLLPAEQERIRRAADTLVFCADLVSSPAARAELSELYELRDNLVSSGRWTPERASVLLDDLWACGPGLDVPLTAAA
jgi:hypothetical protein